MKRVGDLFDQVIAFENLLASFRAAAKGKRDRPEAIHYRHALEPNIFRLRDRLAAGDYAFGPYRRFRLFDPKPREIVAAPFEDRIAHHALCNVLVPVFEPTFIRDTYACIEGRGTHAAVLRLQGFMRSPGATHALQCDVRKYFQSVDHRVLKGLVRRKVKDARVLDLVDRVIDSAPTSPARGPGKGLPIGNLTSQLFANVYLDPLDHFVKEGLRVKRYVRYVDDFVALGSGREDLLRVRGEIAAFLRERLLLAPHPDKCHVFPARRGITFLGYRVFANRIRVKTATLVRMRRREHEARRAYWDGEIAREDYWQVASSLLGHVRLGDPSGALRAEMTS
jgi:RNA-directed DNA polymerase